MRGVMVNVTAVVVVSLMVTVVVLLVKNWNLATALENQHYDFKLTEKNMMDEHANDLSRYNALKNSANKMQGDLRSLQQQLSDAENYKKKLEADVSSKAKDLTKLRTELQQSQDEQKTQQEAAERSQNELSIVNQELEKKKEELKNTQENLHKNLATLRDYQQNNAKLSKMVLQNEKLKDMNTNIQQHKDINEVAAAVKEEQKDVKRSVPKNSPPLNLEKSNNAETNVIQAPHVREKVNDNLEKVEDVVEESNEDQRQMEAKIIDKDKNNPLNEKREQLEEDNYEVEAEGEDEQSFKSPQNFKEVKQMSSSSSSLINPNNQSAQ